MSDDFDKYKPTEDELNEIFEASSGNPIEPIIIEEEKEVISHPPVLSVSPSQPTKDEDKEKDIKFLRDSLKDMIQKGKSSFEMLQLVAQTSQQPRAYEVLAELMDSILSAHEKMMQIHNIRQDIDLKQKKIDSNIITDDESTNKTITNNTLFVGPTSELLDAIIQKKKDMDGK